MHRVLRHRPRGADRGGRAGVATVAVRTTIPVALVTLALAATLLASGGRVTTVSADRPAHAPTHFSSPFAGLSPARDVWGQYDQSP